MTWQRGRIVPAVRVWVVFGILGTKAAIGISPESFRHPPREDRPWVYWWWLKSNVDRETIVRDLRAMRDVGVSGFLLFDVRGYHEDHVPPPPEATEFMSRQWRQWVRDALEEADRLGLQASINLSSCAGSLMGPWPVGEDAPKQLLWSRSHLRGPARLDAPLPSVPLGVRPIAILAARTRPTCPTPPVQESQLVWTDWSSILGEPQPDCVATEVVDLTDKEDAERRLTWDIPEGEWALIRFAYGPMTGREREVDVLDAEAVTRHFERMGRALLQDAGPLAGRTLTHFYSVSWEGATPTWTRDFEPQFARYRGYAMRPWMPVLAGVTVHDPGLSRRFLRDYHAALAACFCSNFYGTLHRLCREVGLQWHAESGGPWNRSIPLFAAADQLAFLGRTDMPQGEFWFPGRGNMGRPPEFNRPAAIAAHVYGRRLAAAEAFTHMVQHWSAYPAVLKPTADAAFCDGINHLIWHTFTASPERFGLPGIEYFAGTHFNPNVTWWPMAQPFVDYLARAQHLLRHGRPVVDFCVYIGDRPYLHWGRWADRWSTNASLAAPPGYSWDLVNDEVLLHRLTTRDGFLLLPEGLPYHAMVVDLAEEYVAPAVLEKLFQLAEQGATIVLGPRRPTRAHSLADYPNCDLRVQTLAERLWGAGDVTNPCVSVGRGRIYRTSSLEQVVRELGLPPDVEGGVEYAHRSDGTTDVYFIRGSGRQTVRFRCRGRIPELWCPVRGDVRPPTSWRVGPDDRAEVDLDLPEHGSVFVVFRDPASRTAGWSVSNGNHVEVRSVRDGRLTFTVWQSGEFVCERSGTVQRIQVSEVPPPKDIEGPWDLRFQPGRGAPAQVRLERLSDWTQHGDPSIRFFSGIAVYRTTVRLSEAEAAGRVRLDLGRVGVIARVRWNGHDLGVVWTAPWLVEVTPHVRAGENQLEVEVANVWMNRLIGDASLPPEQRITRTNVRLEPGPRTVRIFQGFGTTDHLEPSGLMGPVRLVFGRDIECL